MKSHYWFMHETWPTCNSPGVSFWLYRTCTLIIGVPCVNIWLQLYVPFWHVHYLMLCLSKLYIFLSLFSSWLVLLIVPINVRSPCHLQNNECIYWQLHLICLSCLNIENKNNFCLPTAFLCSWKHSCEQHECLGTRSNYTKSLKLMLHV